MREEIRVKINTSNKSQVNLDDLHIEDNEIEAIIAEIKRVCPKVENIFMKNNNITDNGAILLGRGLPQFSNLSFLDLQFNKIGGDGISALLTLMSPLPGLTLALHGNQISNVAEMKKLEDQTRIRPRV